MRFLAIPSLVVMALLGIAPAAAASPPSPAPVHDATHPLVMKQAANDLASPQAGAQWAGAPASAGPTRVAGIANSPQREVFGFALASSLSDPTVGYPSWDFSLLSTVAFFGLHINDDGTIASDSGSLVWNSSQLTSLLSAAHAHGSKVVLTIIEQDFSPGTPHMCAALANRATTVGQTAAQVSAKGVDGVNIDFEGLNGTCPNNQSAQSMMTDLARQLRAGLGAGPYISVDTYASSAADPLGFFDIPGLNAYVDSFFVMAYDLEYSNYVRSPTGCSSFCLGPTAPLAGYYYNDMTTASQYRSAVSASKVILGVPYYGRKSCVAGIAPNAYPTGPVTADTYLNASTEASDPQVQAGSYATHRDANDPSGSERWDTWFNTTLNCRRELYWDDTVSLGLKYDLVNTDALRGVGIWNLNYGGGAPELWNALLTHFVGCGNAGLSANPGSPQPSGARVQLTATSGNCATPLYEFFMKLPGSGTWQVVQPYSTAATYSWNTDAMPTGTYNLMVFARDSASSGTSGNYLGRWDSYTYIAFTINPAPCTAMSAASAPPSSATVGTPITVTTSATGCTNPLYEFWLLPPGGSWALVKPYSSTATFDWSTAGTPIGAYRFSIWTRDASSPGSNGAPPNTYDAFAAFQYTLTTCSGMSASAAPATSASVGIQVIITGNASGCPNPLYEFWLLPPGGSWTLAQAYSNSNTLTWSTAGKATGAYRFSVWARDAASTGTLGSAPYTYDVFSAFNYSLTTAPCTAMSATSVPPTTTTMGTTVTITATAIGCQNPVYELWLLSPGSSWTLVKPYSSSATFKWSTAGMPAGSYRFSVWARDASSAGTNGTPPYTYDAFSAFQYVLA